METVPVHVPGPAAMPTRALVMQAVCVSTACRACAGQERRLIYPAREADAPAADVVTSFEEGWDPERWGESNMSCDFQDAEARLPAAPLAPAREPSSLPSSPGELLRYLASDEHKAEQRAFQRLVASSYEVRSQLGC